MRFCKLISNGGARDQNRTGTPFYERQILNLLCLPISPLGLALAETAALNKSRPSNFSMQEGFSPVEPRLEGFLQGRRVLKPLN